MLIINKSGLKPTCVKILVRLYLQFSNWACVSNNPFGFRKPTTKFCAMYLLELTVFFNSQEETDFVDLGDEGLRLAKVVGELGLCANF